MGDSIKLRTVFINSIVSKIVNGMIKKAGYNATIRFNDISMDHDENGHVKIKFNATVDASENDILKLMHNV